MDKKVSESIFSDMEKIMNTDEHKSLFKSAQAKNVPVQTMEQEQQANKSLTQGLAPGQVAHSPAPMAPVNVLSDSRIKEILDKVLTSPASASSDPAGHNAANEVLTNGKVDNNIAGALVRYFNMYHMSKDDVKETLQSFISSKKPSAVGQAGQRALDSATQVGQDVGQMFGAKASNILNTLVKVADDLSTLGLHNSEELVDKLITNIAEEVSKKITK